MEGLEYDEGEAMTMGITKGLAIHRGGRASEELVRSQFAKRASTNAPPEAATGKDDAGSREEADDDRIVFSFEATGKLFVLRLERAPFVVSDATRLTIHSEQSGNVFSKAPTGAAYVGDRLVVLDNVSMSEAQERYGTDNQALIGLEADDKQGIHVVEDAFGRFFIEDATDSLSGGFAYEGQYVQIQDGMHPMAGKVEKSHALALSAASNAADGNSQQLFSMQQFGAAMTLNQNSPNGAPPRRCGHDKLPYNTDPNGAASFYGQQVTRAMDLVTAKHDDGAPSRGSGVAADGPLKMNSRLAATLKDGKQRQCLATPKVLYIGIVADCSYTEAFHGDAAKAQANIIKDFNIVSGIYERTFNIHIGILSIDLMMECYTGSEPAAAGKAPGRAPARPAAAAGGQKRSTNLMEWNVPCSRGMQMEERLSLFTRWRSGQTADAGLYHLVTGCANSEVVGIAWLNQVCQTKPYEDSHGETVGGVSVTALIKNQFVIIAHEIAHNFGAVHDCDRQACAVCSGANCACCMCGTCDCNDQYLMTPESGGINVHNFSDCTIRDICQKMPVLTASCLRDPGAFATMESASCGNGIRDPGEDCDCGGEERCKEDKCCTSKCKYKEGAVCSDANDECCSGCRVVPAEANYVCSTMSGFLTEGGARNSTCTKDSVCDGRSAACAPPVLTPDGEPCEAGSGGGDTCASGQCTSRSRQCAMVGGRLGLDEACPHETNSCSIICKSPGGGKWSACVALDAFFVDGTPCGIEGRCYGGVCTESIYETFVYSNYLALGLLIGALAFLVVFAAVRAALGALRRRRHRRRLAAMGASAASAY